MLSFFAVSLKKWYEFDKNGKKTVVYYRIKWYNINNWVEIMQQNFQKLSKKYIVTVKTFVAV